MSLRRTGKVDALRAFTLRLQLSNSDGDSLPSAGGA